MKLRMLPDSWRSIPGFCDILTVGVILLEVASNSYAAPDYEALAANLAVPGAVQLLRLSRARGNARRRPAVLEA